MLSFFILMVLAALKTRFKYYAEINLDG